MNEPLGYQEKSLDISSYGKSWSLFYNDSQTWVNRHWHDYPEILYLARGSCDMLLDQRTVHLAAGDLVVIGSGSSHAFPSLAGCLFLVVQILPDFLCGGFGSEWQVLIPFMQAGFSQDTICHLDEQDEILADLREIEQDGREKPPGYELNIKGKLLCLFARLIRRGMITVPQERQLAMFRKLQPALTYVETHFQEPVRVSQAAGCCFMSPHHFSRCFHQATGKTFQEYVMQFRLRKVRELLIKTNLTISAVAREAGFSTASHLTAAFRKTFGLTPAAWRCGATAKPHDLSNK